MLNTQEKRTLIKIRKQEVVKCQNKHCAKFKTTSRRRQIRELALYDAKRTMTRNSFYYCNKGISPYCRTGLFLHYMVQFLGSNFDVTIANGQCNECESAENEVRRRSLDRFDICVTFVTNLKMREPHIEHKCNIGIQTLNKNFCSKILHFKKLNIYAIL